MSNVVYDSGEVAGPAAGETITLNHNLGYKANVIALYRVIDGQITGWEPADAEDPSARGCYISVQDEQKIQVTCEADYTYSGNVQVKCFQS